MGKAVAYYRSRPGEPEASELALRRQREAVQEELGRGFHLVAEFTEREGEAGSEAWPAYAAAVRAASAHSSPGLMDVTLMIASQAGIGTGGPFREPSVEGAGGFTTCWLQVRSVPALERIALPGGAPGPLCLYAVCCPQQLDTLVYLCNAGPDALADVVVTTDTLTMGECFGSNREERWADGCTQERRWAMLPPGTGVLVALLDHLMWDFVSRHRVAWTDPAGWRCTAEAHDVSLNICDLSEHPDEPWVAFRPVPQGDATAPDVVARDGRRAQGEEADVG